MTREDGFTLIELLVALTLLGVLFVLLLGGLRFGTRAWERSAAHSDAGDTVRSVQGLLRGEIERACPRHVAGARPEDPPRVLFAGDEDGLRFLGPAPGATGGGSCVDIALAVRPDGTLKRLILGDTDLLRRAASVRFAYKAAEGGWTARWRGADLPALVRLRVSFPGGDLRTWPELFIAPRISAEADCTYDPATKSCRGT